MTLQDLSNISTFLAAIATGSSVLFALFTYKKNLQREMLKGVRENLTTYRMEYEAVDDILDVSCSVELGHCIASELKGLLPRTSSIEDVSNFLSKENNEKYLYQACYMGISKVNSLKSADQKVQKLKVLSSIDREMFPITGKILSLFSLYPASILTTLNSAEHQVELLQDEDAISELVKQGFSGGEEELLYWEIASWIIYVSDTLQGRISDRLAESAQPIVDIIISIFESSSDAELIKMSKEEQKLKESIFNNARSTHEDETHQAFFELLKFYKPYISSSDWDTIVESKTMLGLVHTENQDI